MTSASEPARRRRAWVSRGLALPFGLSLLSLAVAPRVRAEPVRDEAELDPHLRTAARTLAAQGSVAFDQGEYEQALDLFRRASALVEAPTIVLMEARTLVQLGRFIEASDRLVAVQRVQQAHLQAGTSNPTFDLAAGAATQELAQLAPRIPSVKLTVSQIGDADPFEVYVDGRKLPEALVGVDVPLDPGEHSFEVRPEGKESVERAVSVTEGEHQELEIELVSVPPPELAPASPPEPTPSAPAPPRTEESGPSRSTLAFALLGVGVTGTVVGSVTGLVALGKRSDLEEQCSPGCPSSMADTLDAYRLNRSLSYIGFAVGLAGVASGGYLLVTGTDEAHEHVALGATYGGALLRGRF